MKTSLTCLLLLVFTSLGLASSLDIKTTKVPNGVVKAAYSSVITASGGCTPYAWQLVSGALPDGVTMTTTPGTTSVALSGAPKKAASYSFTVSVTGCGGHVAQASYTIVVQATADHVVDLNWTASTSTDVVGYNVYRGSDGKSWMKINTGLAASTTYSDPTVADTSTYYYATTAVDVSGLESDKSNIVKTAVP